MFLYESIELDYFPEYPKPAYNRYNIYTFVYIIRSIFEEVRVISLILCLKRKQSVVLLA